jgi:hypothetical protein
VKRTIVDKYGFHAGAQHVDHHRAGSDIDMERGSLLLQSAREPRSLKEIVRIKWSGYNTISKAWVGITEKELLCTGLPFISFPFPEITRQRSQACQEARPQKRRPPPDDCAVAEKLPHDGGDGKPIIINGSSLRTMARKMEAYFSIQRGQVPLYR